MIPTSLKSFGIALVPGLLGTVATLVPGALELEQNVGLDWLFQLRGVSAPPAEVAVVGIDSASAVALGFHRDPDRWPRALHADLVDRLSAAGAALIVFDLSFDAPRDAEQDRALAEAMHRAGNVLLLERLSEDSVAVERTESALYIQRRVPPMPMLAAAALATAPFPLPVVPMKVSQFWVFDSAHGGVPTLPALAFYAYARDAHDELMELISADRSEHTMTSIVAVDRGIAEVLVDLRNRLRDTPGLYERLRVTLGADASGSADGPPGARHALLPALIDLLGGGDSRYLDYYGPARTVRTIPYHEVIGDAWQPAEADLAGRVVFVGFSERSALDQQDTFYTPFSEASGANLSGVEIGATAFANLLHNRNVRPLSIPAHLLLVFSWGVAVAALLLWPPAWIGALAALLVGPAYLAAAHAQFAAAGIWLPLVMPLFVQLPAAALVAVAWRYFRARAFGEHARRTLRYYLPALVTEDAERTSDRVGASPRLLYGTCLVTDAEQYTALSERLSPEELHRSLNDYYSVLFREVERYGGFVTDVVGDSMVAVWPSPDPDAATPEAACRAALAITRAVEDFNASAGRWQMPTRLGLHAGRVLLGDVGAESHFEYRAVGDVVNTASRIQGLNKRLDTRLLVSADALRGTTSFVRRPIGRFLLAGKGTPLELYELLGTEDAIARGQAELAEAFGDALTLFRAREWRRAADAFRALSARFGNDGPSRYYLDRCTELAARDPGPTWDGTIAVTQK